MAVKLEVGVREALDEVFAHGAQDGFEHAIVLREGKVIGRADGTDRNVNFKNVDVRPGDVLVHNHPKSLNALSNIDIVQLFVHGLKAIYAISRDRSIYKAEPTFGHLSPGVFMMLSQQAAQVVETEAAMVGESRLGDDPDRASETVGVGHWINRMMADVGFIKYSFELSAESQRCINEIDRAIGFDVWQQV